MRSLNLLSLLSLAVAFEGSVASAGSAHQHRANHDAVAKRLNTVELREPNNATLSKRFSGTTMTWYQTGLGNCGWHNSGNQFVIALSIRDMYQGGKYCGKTLTINYNGRSAQAEVVDSCEHCRGSEIDLSKELFRHFVSPQTPEYVGVIHADWFFNDGSGGGGGGDGGGKSHDDDDDDDKPKTTKKHTTTHKAAPTSASSEKTSSKPTSSASKSSSSEVASATPSPPVSTGNLSKLNQVVLNVGGMLAAGANAA